ncbi:hypothetical protein FV233_19545 [Methylobacterium sp. WL7]|nr:hypothetical protein FV233_19545 [Methylobacterium sp. WL7]
MPVGGAGSLSRVGEGQGEGCDLSGQTGSLTPALSRTGEGGASRPARTIAPQIYVARSPQSGEGGRAASPECEPGKPTPLPRREKP